MRRRFNKWKLERIRRSGSEDRVERQLQDRGIAYEYEKLKLPYSLECKYITDFVLPNGIILEVKGYLDQEDRRKMKAVKKTHPDKDIRFIFDKPNDKIRRGSKTTYAMWAEANGFPWAEKEIPEEWIKDAKRKPR